MDPEEAREILGATCSLTEDKVRVWYVKMPDLKQATEEMPDIVSPELHWLADEEADLNDYLQDPGHIQWFVFQHKITLYIGSSESSVLRVGMENRVLHGTSGRFPCIPSV